MVNVRLRKSGPCYPYVIQVGPSVDPLAVFEDRFSRLAESRSVSSEPVEHSPTRIHHAKGKTSRPSSYLQHLNSPRATTSVVKDLIVGGGATLVYDSLTQESALPTPPSSLSLPSHPNHYQPERIDSTTPTNKPSFAPLTTGRQHLSDQTHSITTVSMPTKTRVDSVSKWPSAIRALRVCSCSNVYRCSIRSLL